MNKIITTTLDVEATLRETSSLVEKINDYKFSDGVTFAEKMTIEEFPFWEIFSVEFAHSHLPPVIVANETFSWRMFFKLKTYLGKYKHIFLDQIEIFKNRSIARTWPIGKTILLLAFTDSMYRDILKPLIIELSKHTRYNFVILSEKKIDRSNIVISQNCSYETIWQHIDKDHNIIKDRLIRKLKINSKLIDKNELLLNVVPNYFNAVSILFHRFFKSYLYRILDRSVIARHILDSHRPILVITPDMSDSKTRIYTSLCNKYKIPSLDIQYAVTGNEGLWSFFRSDFIAAWGNSSKTAMLNQGVPTEKIVITGSPRHDFLSNLNIDEIYLTRKKLGIPQNAKVILLASAYHLNTHDKYSDPDVLHNMQSSIFKAAVNFKDIFLVVKPHPHENIIQTKKFIKETDNIIYIEKKSDIRELIKISDVFISFGSTCTIDALIAGKLSICPIFPGWNFSNVFKESNAVLIPTTKNEIFDIFRDISLGKDLNILNSLANAREIFLNDFAYKTDGCATKRISNLALSIIK